MKLIEFRNYTNKALFFPNNFNLEKIEYIVFFCEDDHEVMD